ncbi:MAG: alpha/beta fold hydrolase [Rhizobiales bacterium]|nr:alpha/beta fold hydrolase [Hyphomicrobiales bacterium]
MIVSFDQFQIDTEKFELRKAGESVPVEPQVFELIVYLAHNRDRVIGHEELFEKIWNGRIVSQSTLTSRINAARAAIGDDGGRQALIKTVPRKGYRFVGQVKAGQSPASTSPSGPVPAIRQDIQFCQSKDGTHIAYASSGAGPLIVKAANWMSHLEFELNGPVWGHWLAAISERHRLVRYDGRGNGLSARHVEDLSVAAMVADLEAVVASIGAQRFTLFAIGQGCATAITYAARHPDKVARLILYGGYSRGWRARGDLKEIAWRSALGTLIDEGWARGATAFRQIFTSLFMPGGSPEQMDWYNELQLMTAEPAMARRLHDAFGDLDVSETMKKVAVPTLVLHARNDVICPFDAGLAIAAGIPGARFVPLESVNHILLEDEPAFARFVAEMNAFASNSKEVRLVSSR